MVLSNKNVQDQVVEIQKLISDASDTLRQASWALETLTHRLAIASESPAPRPLASTDSGSPVAAPDAAPRTQAGPDASDAEPAAEPPIARGRHRRWARGAQRPPPGRSDA